MDNISKLKREQKNYEINVAAAILIKHNNVIDTIYTNKFCTDWVLSNENYSDPEGGMAKLIGGLFVFRHLK